MEKVRGEIFCSLFQELRGGDKVINCNITFICKLIFHTGICQHKDV